MERVARVVASCDTFLFRFSGNPTTTTGRLHRLSLTSNMSCLHLRGSFVVTSIVCRWRHCAGYSEMGFDLTLDDITPDVIYSQ